MRYNLLLVLFFAGFADAFAVTCPDSIGVKTAGANHYIMHKVATSEGWYGISRRYGVPVSNIREANKSKGESLKLNDTILVPINIARIGENTVPADKAKMIKEKSPQPTMDSSQKYRAVAVNSKPSTVNHSSTKEMTETGVATWISDDDVNPNKYYALHRTAPTGTIIKVTNKMNNKYIFVKVVGVLPDTGDNTNTVIKISKASAEKLGVRDPKFQCALSYMATAAK